MINSLKDQSGKGFSRVFISILTNCPGQAGAIEGERVHGGIHFNSGLWMWTPGTCGNLEGQEYQRLVWFTEQEIGIK